jgi:hypothetical protein
MVYYCFNHINDGLNYNMAKILYYDNNDNMIILSYLKCNDFNLIMMIWHN